MSSSKKWSQSERANVTRRSFMGKITAATLGAGTLLDSVAQSQSVGETADMKYRFLGKTGISVSEVGFGSHVVSENIDDPTGRAAQIKRGLTWVSTCSTYTSTATINSA